MLHYLGRGVLYEDGGLGDQPAGLMDRMQSAYAVYEAYSGWLHAKNRVAWTKENPSKWQIVQDLLKMRKTEAKIHGSEREAHRHD